MTFRAKTLMAAAGASLALAAPASAAPCQNADKYPGEVSEQQLAKATVCLLNKQRARRGIRKLRLNARLSKAARSHTTDMVKRNYFSHNSRSGTGLVDRLKSTGYITPNVAWTVGENLAWGSGSRSTPGQIVRAWMNSLGHRTNILQRRFREIGIGVVFEAPRSVGGQRAATYTTTFGARS